jgi:hypothetical protein
MRIERKPGAEGLQTEIWFPCFFQYQNYEKFINRNSFFSE